jgi:hypothetical protein
MVETFGRMARVPITARQKFNEAAYFYNGMFSLRTNVVIFPYYLSAFLSALRSVTWYLQKQYAHDPRFAAWYPQKQAEMRADPVLRMLDKNRDAVVHREPFDLYFRRGFEMPEKYGEYIETTHFEQIEDETPDGRIRTRIRVGADAQEEEVVPWITWHFSEKDKEDVMNHCHAGLEKIDAILKELELLRIGMGLPPDEEIPAEDGEANDSSSGVVPGGAA